MEPHLKAWSATAACVTAVFVCWTGLELGGPDTTRAFDDLALLAAAVAAAVSCFVRAGGAAGRDRSAWRLLGLACSSWGAGQLVWTLYQQVLGWETPFPSLADAGYVLAMPLAGSAVLRFAWVPARVSRLRSLLAASMIAASFACLSWFSALERAWQAQYDSPVAKALALAYPVGTAVAACLVVVVVGRCGRARASLLLVGAGVMTSAATNTVYAYLLADGRYSTGHAIDAGWLVSFLLVGLAARVPPPSPPCEGEEHAQALWSLLLPYAPVGLVVILASATLVAGGELDRFIVSAVIALVALVLAHHCSTLMEQKQVEAKLRAMGRQLNEAQALSHIGSWEWEVATGSLFLSDEFYRIHGMEPGSQSLSFDTYRELVHPEDRAVFDAASALLSAEGGVADVQYRVVLGDASVRWLHGRGQPTSHGRRGDRSHGTVEDVTERKHAEDALRFQAGLLQAVAHAVIATDPQGRVMYWNGAAERLYGWAAEEVSGCDVVQLLAPEDVVDEAAALMARLAAGESWSGEFWLRRRDGSRFPALVADTPVLDDAGNLVAVIGTSTDVSERRRVHELLRASEERFRRLVEASPLAILELDADGRVRLCNRAAEDTFYGQRHAAGDLDEKVRRYLALDDVLTRVMAGERITDHELRASRDGRDMHLEVAADALRNTAGDVTGAIVVGADVSHRKSLESQLLQAQKLEAVGRLAGGIAHDFNNLLTIVLGHAELLLNDVADDAAVRPELEAIREAALRGSTLTNRLLTFSRKRLSTRTVVDLNDAVLSVRDLLARTLGEDIAVEARTEPGAGCVAIERSELDQVLLNLAVNGRDAMPGGGTLVIATSRFVVDDSPGAAWPGIPAGDYAVVTVTDTGIGMDAESCANCFEPFFTTKPQGKGTGLGLATVYGIVSGVDGHVCVESSPGKGSAFTLLIPAVPAPSPPRKGPDEQRRNTAGVGATVLVVEDEEHVRTLAVRVLEREGYRVLAAANGADALSAFAGALDAVDVLVTDVVMPELGGIELAKEVSRRHPEVDVIFISGYTDRVLPELRAGEKPWLVEKPFEPHALVRTVHELLRSQARRRAEDRSPVVLSGAATH